MGQFCGEGTFFDESVPYLLEPPTTVVATQLVTENPKAVTVSFCSPITPAPLLVVLIAATDFLHQLTVAAAPVDFILSDRANFGAIQPSILEQPQFPTQDVRISDNSEESLPNGIS